MDDTIEMNVPPNKCLDALLYIQNSKSNANNELKWAHTHTHTLLPTTITDNINWKLKLSAPTTQTSRLKFNRTTWNMNPSSICSRWFTIHYCCHLRGFFTFPFSLCHCRMGCPQWKVTWNFFFIHLDFMVSDTYYEFHIVAFHSVFKFSVYISCNRKRIEPSNLNTDSMATCP